MVATVFVVYFAVLFTAIIVCWYCDEDQNNKRR